MHSLANCLPRSDKGELADSVEGSFAHNPTLLIVIDSSHLRNVYGRVGVGPTYCDRSRKGPKVSAITDGEGFPLGLRRYRSNFNNGITLIPFFGPYLHHSSQSLREKGSSQTSNTTRGRIDSK